MYVPVAPWEFWENDMDRRGLEQTNPDGRPLSLRLAELSPSAVPQERCKLGAEGGLTVIGQLKRAIAGAATIADGCA